ncbi:MAG: hypothetical protein HUU28_15745, partial [Planctomycetaceae bacterium]|nr:hypothetical protein [Planctomycetaceae bacterium]
RTRAWEGRPRADVASALAERPDFVVPTIRFGEEPPTAQDIAAAWVNSLDTEAHRPQRAMGIRTQFADYELVTVPVLNRYSRAAAFPDGHFYLMRRTELDLAPKLRVRLEGRSFEIEVEHRSHPQLVDLRVQLTDRNGNLWSLRPWGQFEREPQLLSRTRILLQDAGQRRVSLVRAQLPSNVNAVELRAVLRNPGATGDSIFAFASREAIVAVPR